MTQYVHSFDEHGYYSGSAELPPGAVGANPEVATLSPLPQHNPETERVRWMADSWAVEAIPETPPEPEPEPTPDQGPQYPRFYGNAKLDLFTPAEQLAVVTETMSDPVVKLMYDRLLGAAYLAYEDAETEQGLQLLVDKGLLTAARKAEIVARMTGQEI